MKYLIFCFLIVYCIFGYNQTDIHTLIIVEKQHDKVMQNIERSQKHSNLNESYSFLQSLETYFHTQGYYAASYDSIIISDTLVKAFFNPGFEIIVAQIRNGNIEPRFADKLKPEFRQFSGNTYTQLEIGKLLTEILSLYENNGYPFASVRIDSLEFQNNQISGVVMVNPRSLVIWDTIINEGGFTVDEKVFYAIIGFSPGDPYNEQLLRELDERLKRHRFLRMSSAPRVQFTNEGAVLLLKIDKKPANTFDGIMGFMPDYQNNGKLAFTGEILLGLSNSLSLAEQFQIRWKQTDKLSQEMRISAQVPYLVYVPFGVEWSFLLQRKDTTYLTVNNTVLLHYNFLRSKISVYVQQKNSSLLSNEQYASISKLPPVIDMKISSLGIIVESSILDNPLQPRHGWYGISNLQAGKKIIEKNSGINPDLYNALPEQDFRLQLELETGYFVPLFKHSCFLLSQYAGVIHAENLFVNELFRLGGLRHMRGFDELFFYASLFSVQTFEYRRLLGENSRFSIFADWGYVEQETVDEFLIFRPFGIGSGIVLETDAGQFTLYYATGKQTGNSFDLKSSKIHFGYLILF